MYAYMGEVSLCNVRVKFYLGTGQVNETRATGCLAVLHELQTKQKIISLYQNILKHSTPTKIQIYQNSGFEGKIHYFDLVYEGCSNKLKLLKLNKITHHCHCHWLHNRIPCTGYFQKYVPFGESTLLVGDRRTNKTGLKVLRRS